MIIRRASIADIPAISDLSGQLGYADEVSVVQRRFAAINSDPAHAVFVAESDEGVLIGWIHILPRILLISRPIVEIGALVIDEKERRKGIGRQLVSRAEQWSRDNGYRGIVVRSDTRRSEAHEFYPGAGFDYLKEQRVYIKYF